MLSLFIYLIVHFLLTIAFILYALFLYISAMSSGVAQTVDAPSFNILIIFFHILNTIKTEAFPAPQYRKIVVDDLNIYGLIYVGAMFYWWMTGFSNFNKFVQSGAISTFYFSKAKQILNVYYFFEK